ncbi:MAG: TetR/AcrR family transcriptional regulator [Gammaproteobacteria bacterium]
MARRSEHSLEELKALVLDAAERIVIQEGFSALKVRKIAVEIGYTVGSIYMVFANMADLIMHINARTLDNIVAQLEQVQDLAADQCIEALAQTYLSYASQNFNRWNMLFEYRLPQNVDTPAWYQEKFDAVFDRFEESYIQLAPECSKNHRRQAAHALWGGVHGICMLSLSGKLDRININDVSETVALLVRNFIRGCVAPSSNC